MTAEPEPEIRAPEAARRFIANMPPVGRRKSRIANQLTRHQMELVCASYTAGFDIEVIADHFEVTPRKVRSILREWCPRFVQSEEASDQALLELSGHAPPIGSRERIGTFTLRSILIDRVGEAPSFYASTIRHLCGLAWCTEHLAWGTAKDNAMDRKFHETYGYGQLAPESYRETA